MEVAFSVFATEVILILKNNMKNKIDEKSGTIYGYFSLTKQNSLILQEKIMTSKPLTFYLQADLTDLFHN